MKVTSEQKSNIGAVVAIIGSVIGVGTLIYNYSGKQTKSDITYIKQEEMAKNVSEIKDVTNWTKTTLLDHMKEDDKREFDKIQKDQELKQTIIDQNKELIKVLEKK